MQSFAQCTTLREHFRRVLWRLEVYNHNSFYIILVFTNWVKFYWVHNLEKLKRVICKVWLLRTRLLKKRVIDRSFAVCWLLRTYLLGRFPWRLQYISDDWLILIIYLTSLFFRTEDLCTCFSLALLIKLHCRCWVNGSMTFREKSFIKNSLVVLMVLMHRECSHSF